MGQEMEVDTDEKCLLVCRLVLILMLGSKKILISNIFWPLQIYMISSECGFQILMTKICHGRRMSYILTSLIPNSLLSSKHFTY